MRYFSSKKRKRFLWQSFLGILALILLVIGIVVGIYIMRFTIRKDVGISAAQTIASVANSIQIQVLNFVYSKVATALSERENHRYVRIRPNLLANPIHNPNPI